MLQYLIITYDMSHIICPLKIFETNSKQAQLVCSCATKIIDHNIALKQRIHMLIMIARPGTSIQEDQKAKNLNGDVKKANVMLAPLVKPVGMILETRG